MKTLYNYICEGSLLDNVDDIIANGDNKASQILIQEYLKNNYKGKWIISEKPNKDGLYEVSSNTAINVKNIKITSLTNGMFVWTSVKGNFDCSYCKSLKSLEGAPKEVGINFSCSECNSLKSLDGAPEIVNGSFYCNYCGKLESLKGAPKEVGDSFSCSNCNSLKTLESAPKEVGSTFYCYNCGKLTSLEGAPKEVGGDFDCTDCGKKFTKDDIKNVSKIKGNIYC